MFPLPQDELINEAAKLGVKDTNKEHHMDCVQINGVLITIKFHFDPLTKYFTYLVSFTQKNRVQKQYQWLIQEATFHP